MDAGDHDFTDKIIFVTGASRGIGRALSYDLVSRGATVIALARTVGALEALDDECAGLPGRLILLPYDLGKLGGLEAVAHSLASRFGKLDGLVCNAGILGPLGPSYDISRKDWDKVFTVNVHANVALVRNFHPLLLVAEAGRVVFTTSGFADAPKEYWGAYASSKAALRVFAQTYALEVAGTSIRSNEVNPGAVDTAMLSEAYPGRYQKDARRPEDVVPLFLGALSSECTQNGSIFKLP